MNILLAVLLSYLIGSIPTGYIICKILKGIDIRTAGSKNIGATNVARVVGKKAGITTLILDILKGFVVVITIPRLFGSQSHNIEFACFLSVIAGHNWTIFLKFKGGKGVATTAGGLIGLVPIVFLSCFCVWCAIFALWRYVSLASIIAALSLPVFLFLFKEPLLFQILGVIIAITGIYKHKDNIRRLIKGEEHKFIV
jgi:glycerol-3-phosphate acyltransferase PlsY